LYQLKWLDDDIHNLTANIQIRRRGELDSHTQT